MGFGDFLKKLVGGERKGPWSELSGDDLDRVWSSHATLSARACMQLRDEYVARERVFPFAEGGGLTTPLLPGLGDLLARESLLVYLKRLDPHARPADTVIPYAAGALVECGDGEYAHFSLPVWVPGVAHEPPRVPGGGRIVETVAHDDPRGELEIGRLAVTRLEAGAGVWEVVDDHEELRILIGPSIPIPLLGGEEMATDVIGGLRSPATEEDVEQLEALEWDLEDLVAIDRVIYLPDVADTCGVGALVQAEGLRLRTAAIGSVLPASAEVHSALAGVLSGDTAALEADLAAWEPEDLPARVAELLAWLLSSENATGFDRAIAAVEATDRPEVPPNLLLFFRGAARQLAGDAAGGAGLFADAVGGDEPNGYALAEIAVATYRAGDRERASELAATAAERAQGEDVIAANHALTVWMGGARERAFDIVQETQVATRGWLGPLVDATVHEGEPAVDGFGLFSPVGFRFGPLLTAAALLRGGDDAAGERLLRRCLALEPNRPAAVGLLCLHLVATDRQGEALALCDEVVGRIPYFHSLRLLRAWLAMQAERYDSVEEDLLHVLSSAPDHIEARVSLIFCRLARGDKKGAAEQASALYHEGADMALADAVRVLVARKR